MELGTKAAVGAGSVPLATQIVDVGLWVAQGCPMPPPQDVVLGLAAIVGIPLVYFSTYWTPHKTTTPSQDGNAPPPAPAVVQQGP